MGDLFDIFLAVEEIHKNNCHEETAHEKQIKILGNSDPNFRMEELYFSEIKVDVELILEHSERNYEHSKANN